MASEEYMSILTPSDENAFRARTALGVVCGLLAPIKGPVFDAGEFYEILTEDCDFTMDEAIEAADRLVDDGWLRWTGHKHTRAYCTKEALMECVC
jgi:hypothetical protein